MRANCYNCDLSRCVDREYLFWSKLLGLFLLFIRAYTFVELWIKSVLRTEVPPYHPYHRLVVTIIVIYVEAQLYR